MVGDTDSDPDIARLDTKMPMPSTLTSADDKTVSELEEDEYGNDDFEVLKALVFSFVFVFSNLHLFSC